VSVALQPGNRRPPFPLVWQVEHQQVIAGRGAADAMSPCRGRWDRPRCILPPSDDDTEPLRPL
jgi:hypothetical protein